MDFQFNWMTQPYNDAARIEDDMEKRQVMQGMQRGPQGIAQAYAQNVAAQQAQQAQEQKQREIFQHQMAQAQVQQQQQMAQEAQAIQQQQQLAAKQARLAELQGKFAKITNDPKMRMAAMLMMAGQPGALQAFLTEGSKGGVSEAQSSLDELEKSMANDMFGLVGLSNSDYDKLTGALIPIYKSKWEELVNKGARSRLGNDWASAWGTHFERGAKGRKDAKDKAEANKKAAKATAATLFGG